MFRSHRGMSVGTQSCDLDVPHEAAVPDSPSTPPPGITVTILSRDADVSPDLHV